VPGPEYDSCVIPGPSLDFPYGISDYDVCGGASAVSTRPLTDTTGKTWGRYHVFRDYKDVLYITVALDGSSSSQPLLE